MQRHHRRHRHHTERDHHALLKAVIIALAAALALSAALAQVPAPLTDQQIFQARAQAAEAQLNYVMMLLRRAQDEKQETAKWWADYIGLPEKK